MDCFAYFQPPTLDNLGGSTSIGDNTPVGTSIHQFTATDQDDVVACTVDNGDFTVTAVDGAAGTQRTALLSCLYYSLVI